MRDVIWWSTYAPLALMCIGLFLVVAIPVLTIEVLFEKYRARRDGKTVNWHIFKEGL